MSPYRLLIPGLLGCISFCLRDLEAPTPALQSSVQAGLGGSGGIVAGGLIDVLLANLGPTSSAVNSLSTDISICLIDSQIDPAACTIRGLSPAQRRTQYQAATRFDPGAIRPGLDIRRAIASTSAFGLAEPSGADGGKDADGS